jgi:hypothetical protein
LDSSKAKVADFQIAVLVDEDVARLQISVHDTGRMYVLKAPLRYVRGK